MNDADMKSAKVLHAQFLHTRILRAMKIQDVFRAKSVEDEHAQEVGIIALAISHAREAGKREALHGIVGPEKIAKPEGVWEANV